MTAPPQDKKNQHFVPAGYLRKFTIDGEKSLVWEYDKQGGTATKYPASIKQICSRPYYYYQRNEAGEIDHRKFEDAAGKMETLCLKIIQQIRPDNCGRIQMEEEKQGRLAFFIAFLLTRGPCVRDGIHDQRGAEAEILLQYLYYSGKLPEMPSELKACVEKNGIENTINCVIFPEVSLRIVTEMAHAISYQMLKKKWRFYVPAQGMAFITSDNPVSFGSGNGLNFYWGPGHPLAEITLPLRKDLAIVVSPYQEVTETIAEKDQFYCRTATIQQTAIINKRTAASALRYIYSSEKSIDILELVQSVKGTCQKYISGKRAAVVDNPYIKDKER